ncbi:MAG: M48 family metallopeptidase [Rikenellaceae bacterium]|jgi:predicted metal-dependent hydrolase|nr:M48 family metallopeptidase [Rikenellaceae bacterium]
MKKIVEHQVLGAVTVFRTRRAVRVSLSVRPSGEVRLSYPALVSQRRALRFLDERVDWVIAQREKLAERYPTEPIMEYKTRQHTLRLAPVDTAKISVKITDTEIVVTYPATIPPETDEVQTAVEKGIVEALRREAKETLPPLVERLAAEHGLRHGAVRVKALKSKWGSCTARGDINLSLFLMLLPAQLVEYVVLHELCHTVHHDHSARFHALLDTLTAGHSKALNRQLRTYRPNIRFRSKI